MSRRVSEPGSRHPRRQLVVKVEVWPDGDPTRAREVGRLGTANVSALADLSDYSVTVVEDGTESGAFIVLAHRLLRTGLRALDLRDAWA